MTVKTLEDGLAQMKADYQAALDSQGVVSGAGGMSDGLP